MLMAVGRGRCALEFADENAIGIDGSEARRIAPMCRSSLASRSVRLGGHFQRQSRPISSHHHSLPLLTVVNDNHGFPCMLFGHEGVESMLMTKLVLAAAIAFAETSTTAAAQTPERVPLLRDTAGGNTIAIYYKENVYDPADQKIGQILDLVIKKDGAVPAAIVSVGGFLGLASKYVAIRSLRCRSRRRSASRTSSWIRTRSC